MAEAIGRQISNPTQADSHLGGLLSLYMINITEGWQHTRPNAIAEKYTDNSFIFN